MIIEIAYLYGVFTDVWQFSWWYALAALIADITNICAIGMARGGKD